MEIAGCTLARCGTHDAPHHRWSLYSVAALGLMAAVGSSGCVDAPDWQVTDESAERLQPATEASSEAESGPLPAWEDPPLARGKADQFDDIRASNPARYGVTAPPSLPIRPGAEYEPTQAVMIRPGPDVGKFHASIIRELANHVASVWVVHAQGQAEKMRQILLDVGVPDELLIFVDVTKTDANWIRDFGPLPIITDHNNIGFVDFRYYHQRALDDGAATMIAEWAQVPVFRPSLSLEGGNLMADTQGTCYLTEKLYTQNAGHSESEVDLWMTQYLGCNRLIIVKRPEHLSTGHIDMFAKLTGPHTVLVGAYEEGVEEVNAAILDQIAVQLGSLQGEDGAPMTVLRIPMPPFVDDVWYTYTNSLLVNDVLLMPTFSKFAVRDQGPSLETQARAVYRQALPDVEIVDIPSDSIIKAGGAVHCMTMSLPEGSLVAFQPPPVMLCELNELDKCGENLMACKGWPAEGECVGNTLRYCGADGYPREVPCDGCCGWEAWTGTMGGYVCLPESECGDIQSCTLGETGCSEQATHRWTCAPTGDGVNQRRYDRCERGPCIEGECPGLLSEYCQEEGSRCFGGFALTCSLLSDGGFDATAQACDTLPSLCVVANGTAACVAAAELGGECERPGQRRCRLDGAGAAVCARREEDGRLAWTDLGECVLGEQCLDGVCLPVPAVPEAGRDAMGDTQGVDISEAVSSGGCSAGGGSRLEVILLLMAMAVVAVRKKGRGKRRVPAR